MRSWSLRGIERCDRKNFIIQCLQEYIEEVEKMDIRNSPYIEDIETCEIADLYQAIVEELSD